MKHPSITLPPPPHIMCSPSSSSQQQQQIQTLIEIPFLQHNKQQQQRQKVLLHRHSFGLFDIVCEGCCHITSPPTLRLSALHVIGSLCAAVSRGISSSSSRTATSARLLTDVIPRLTRLIQDIFIVSSSSISASSTTSSSSSFSPSALSSSSPVNSRYHHHHHHHNGSGQHLRERGVGGRGGGDPTEAALCRVAAAALASSLAVYTIPHIIFSLTSSSSATSLPSDTDYFSTTHDQQPHKHHPIIANAIRHTINATTNPIMYDTSINHPSSSPSSDLEGFVTLLHNMQRYRYLPPPSTTTSSSSSSAHSDRDDPVVVVRNAGSVMNGDGDNYSEHTNHRHHTNTSRTPIATDTDTLPPTDPIDSTALIRAHAARALAGIRDCARDMFQIQSL